MIITTRQNMKELSNFTPKTALIVYENESRKTYVEQRDIVPQNGNYVMGNGKPVSINILEKITEEIKPEKNKICFKTKIPGNLLYLDFNNGDVELIWYCSSTHVKLFFSDNCHIVSGIYLIPQIVFHLKNNEVFVYAVYYDDHTDLADFPLYKAPFLNKFEDESICFGNVNLDLKKEYVEDIINEIENKFFNSEFNTLHDDCIYDFGINIIEVYKADKLLFTKTKSLDKKLSDLWKK